MSRVLYFDCFSGISGDMTLAALLDAGLPLDALTRALGSLAVSGYDIAAEKVMRAGVSATRFTVREHGSHHSHDHSAAPHHSHDQDADSHRSPHHPHHTLSEIFHLIDHSALSKAGKDRAKDLFQRLAEAEAAIHNMPIEKVHLHEVGALDSIIDIVGAVFALEWFGVDRIVASPLNVGGGMVNSAHGVFPVPAPATVRLLGDTPVYSGPVQKELVTPTGALIVTSYASAFGPIPPMSIEQVGYGAGERDFKETPNVLRVLVGREAVVARGAVGDQVTVVECEIDDMNPQIFGTVMERLYSAGAVEVFYTPVQMKKNRPGTLLTVIAPPERKPAVTDVIFRETTTIGVRYTEMHRECLEREIVPVETPVGQIRFKVARRGERVLNAVPEYEDLVRAADAHDLPVKEIQAIATRAYGQLA